MSESVFFQDLAVRSRTGVNVLSVRRNGRVHHNIGSDWTCEAGDVLVVLGGSAQVRACLSALGSRVDRDGARGGDGADSV